MAFFTLWLFTQIENIALLLATGGTLFKWALIAWLLTYLFSVFASRSPDHLNSLFAATKKVRKTAVVLASVGALFFVISALLPNKRDLAIIVGGGVTYEVLTSDTAKELGGKSIDLLRKQLDEALADTNVVTSTVEVIKQEAKQVVEKVQSEAVESASSVTPAVSE